MAVDMWKVFVVVFGFILPSVPIPVTASRETWVYMITSLTDLELFRTRNTYVTDNLGLVSGDLFRLYQQAKIEGVNEYQLLVPDDATLTANYVKNRMNRDACPSTGCLPDSVRMYGEQFLDWCGQVRNGNVGKASLFSKSELGLFLSVFVDLHNPMHVAYQWDLGGVECKVKYNGTITTLRDLWDSHLVDEQLLPQDIKDDPAKAEQAVAKLHSYFTNPHKRHLIDDLKTILHADFEDGDIFQLLTFEKLVTRFTLFNHNFTETVYAGLLGTGMLHGHSPSSMGMAGIGNGSNSNSSSNRSDTLLHGRSDPSVTASHVTTVDPSKGCLDAAKDISNLLWQRDVLRRQQIIAALRLMTLINRGASAPMSQHVNPTYSMIWTVLLGGIFGVGVLVWLVIYPKLHAQLDDCESNDYMSCDDDDRRESGDFSMRHDLDLDADSVFSFTSTQ